MQWVIFLMVFTSINLFSLSLFPPILKQIKDWQDKKRIKVSKELEKIFSNSNPGKFARLYLFLPFGLAIIAFLIFKSIILAIIFAVAGLLLPTFILKNKEKSRKKKFQAQILDSLMMFSSCLKSGLSLLQAVDVLVEEMPPPISQEFGWMAKEIRMGVTLEEALQRLNTRMPSEELELVVNSILVARETGGDLTKVFSRLSTTIRDRRKLKESIRNLTLQGRIQGVIMSVLPFIFVYWVLQFNRHHFDIMLESQIGRSLLIAAIFLQLIGMFLIQKFSRIEV